MLLEVAIWTKDKKYHTLINEQQLYKKVCGSSTCSKTSDAMTISKEFSCSGYISSTEVHLYSSFIKFGSIAACFFATSMLSGNGSIPRTSPPSLDKGYIKVTKSAFLSNLMTKLRFRPPIKKIITPCKGT